ncbi:hypothetical protein [Microvirga sp. BSC39]|uniref:hypothetical protein n=1 Tax=Microvirga sp. BSC39 TaxID=1549810 RepID=UPI0004E94DE7|nr:hypothetical protein [Microvirga sp. BSC39]KFG68674.1 hypothetical protein JH26_14450 [Microvirga sp. BSC39]
MLKRSRILSEQQVADLQSVRDQLMSRKLDRSRRVLGTREEDDALAQIETILINHRAGLARMAGVSIHG